MESQDLRENKVYLEKRDPWVHLVHLDRQVFKDKGEFRESADVMETGALQE